MSLLLFTTTNVNEPVPVLVIIKLEDTCCPTGIVGNSIESDETDILTSVPSPLNTIEPLPKTLPVKKRVSLNTPSS